MKKRVIFGLFLFVIVSLGFVAASQANLINETLNKDYVMGQILSGNIKINLEDYPVDVNVTTNVGNQSIKLLDFLSANSLVEGTNYNCTKVNCLPGYKTKGLMTSLNLEDGQEKYFGLKLERGNSVSINNIYLNLSGNAPASCYNQLYVEALGDPNLFVKNERALAESCGKIRGCFNYSLSSYESSKLVSSYCEKMLLPSAAGYYIGAYLSKTSIGTNSVKFGVYSPDWQTTIGECTLDVNSTSEQEYKCLVSGITAAQAQEYYVCAFGEAGYDIKVKAENSGGNCGAVYQSDAGISEYDYNIFAEPLRYDKPVVIIEDALFQMVFGDTITNYANTYLTSQYANTCSKVGGCILPFKIKGAKQQINFTPIYEYSVSGGSAVLESTNVYDIEPEGSLITAKNLTIDISKANFLIENYPPDGKLKIYIGNDSLNSGISLNITKTFDFDISPKFLRVGLEVGTQITSSETINNSVWDFGNGDVKTVVGNKVYHKFLQSGEYEIKVQAVNSKGQISSRAFKVMVGSPAESAKILLSDYQGRVGNLTVQFATYPDKLSAKMEEIIGFEEIKGSLKKIEGDYALATTDEAYTGIVNGLLAINIPRAINANTKGEVPVVVAAENMNVDIIAKISAKEKYNAEEVKKQIMGWIAQKYNAKITYEQIYAIGDLEDKPLVTKVKIDASPKGELTEQGIYLIVGYPIDTLIFWQGYGEKSTEGATYIPLKGQAGQTEILEFALNGKIEPKEMGVYISPELSNFRGLSFESGENKSVVGFLAVWWIVILVVFLILYILLQEWYKRNYEKSLFKNPDELYNLINFIYNSRLSGMKDAEIEKKLLDSKWSKEKVRYALNKMDGKRTGMFEIPVFKFLENKKVKDELTKRNPEGVKAIDKKPGFLPAQNKNNQQGNKGATFIKR